MAPRINLTDETRKRPYKPRRPYKNKGIKLGRKPGSWITGPDPRRHEQYTAWLKHKSQAAYRGEPHELSFEQWETLWNTDWAWENRGRANACVNLVRRDKEKGWSLDNVEMNTRLRHLQDTARTHTGMKYKQNKRI